MAVALAAALNVIFAGFGFAQAGKSEFLIQVRDASGAVVPGAAVTLTESQTNQEITSTSGSDGFCTFSLVKPGTYAVQVNAPNFRPFRQEGVRLATGERVRLDVTVTLGPVTESIAVHADAPVLRTESATLGQLIDQRTVRDLPLKNRDFISLLSLSPGVALPPGSALPRINGGRPRVNEYLYDGVSVLQPEPGQVAFFPIIDAIQEFKIETNSPSAEFGRFSGGVINLSTKSGTNDVHGSVFKFFRNEVLNARNLFAPATEAEPNKPVFRRNQYGFVLGGPVVRKQTFFFGDY
ncbi:MAG: carboxypeptidase regulatory-like domain-containing protein, partial [Terriglobia bacterium]